MEYANTFLTIKATQVAPAPRAITLAVTSAYYISVKKSCFCVHSNLAGVDHQQGAFARSQRSRHFVLKVHVAGGVDQVQEIDLLVAHIENHARTPLVGTPRGRKR
jgi:hypothetical protein